MEGSKVFESYRALGYYTNHVPIQILYHERLKENFIVTCVGRSYHIYNASKLGLSRVSDPQEHEISCMLACGNRIFLAVQNKIRGIERNKQDVIEFLKHTADIHTLVAYGKHFISIDKNSTVIVWLIETQEPYLEMNFSNSSFEITAALHPATYVNKILFASSQGSMQLWNVKTNKMIYEFTGFGHSVTILKQAPAVDVAGVGLANGDIYLHNLKYDETIIKFHQDWGPVTGLTFRTDGIPIMISASTQGHLAIWNLDDKRLSSQIRNAHDASVTGLECLANEPIMVTSSGDNNLKVWIFDQSDGGARLLHRRQGHAAPVSHVRFYDDTNMMSAGQDCGVFVFSTDHDRHNKSLGRAIWNKRAEVKRLMPAFSQLSCESKRGSDWDDVIAVHNACSTLSLWNTKRGTLTNHLTPVKSAHAVSCTISPCGNFGFVGYQDGLVIKFNMQSKILRGKYEGQHKGPIRSLDVDSMSRLLISGGGDSKLAIWCIKSQKCLNCVTLSSGVAKVKVHKESAMTAVALDDFTLCIVDLETRRVVRRFSGHMGRVTDITFNPSGKWLISSSMDCTVCVWDLLTGSLIDKVQVEQAVTSMDMSPRGEFLALSRLDEPGIFLWSNRTLYMHVALKALTADGEEMEDIEGNFKSSDQIANELVTLSLLPDSRWANLLKLDIIKYRNRLRAPPKIQKAAPFFLPTIPGLIPAFAIEEKTEDNSLTKSQINFTSSSGLDRVLFECVESSDPTAYLNLMKTFGVSTIESEIRCLQPDHNGSPHLLLAFIMVTAMALKARKDYELVQSYLALFLKIHNEDILKHKELLEELAELENVADESWRTLDTMFNKARCLVAYQRSAII